MSSRSFNTPFAISIKPGLQKWLILLIPHALAGLLVLLAPPLDYFVKGVGIVFVLTSFVYYYRLHIRADLKKSVLTVRQDSARNWSIGLQSSKSGDYTHVALLGSSFYSNFLIILNFSDLSQHSMVKATYSVLITPDSLPKDEFRRLKVRLKTNQ